MVFKDSRTLANRSPGSKNIVNQTDRRTLQMIAGTNRKCIHQIFSASDASETGLGHGVPGPDQPMRTNKLSFLRKKQAGQDCRLIKPPLAMPSDMERNRNYPITIGKFRQIAPLNECRNPMSD
jgi:hypothetical protein